MKRALVILAVLFLILDIAGSVWLHQRNQERERQQQAAALQSQVQALEAKLVQRQAEGTQRTEVIIAPVLPRTNPLVAIPAPVPIRAAAPNPALLNDPETRALMQKQQEQGLARLADKLVSKDFVHDWNLSPEQTARVKELVREKAGAGKDLLTAMMFDGLDDDALAQRGREVKQRIERSDEALRGLLGTDGFNALTEKERAQEDSGRLKHFREELANTAEPLTQPQTEALLAAMSAERQSFSFRVNFDDPSKVDPEHIRDHFSEANLQLYFEDMQQLNARIAERAALVLSPTQLEQLKAAQNSQLEQGRLTVKMTTELFNKRRAN